MGKKKTKYTLGPDYSDGSGQSPRKGLSRGQRRAINITVIVLSILLLLGGGACLYVDGMIGKLIDPDSGENIVPVSGQSGTEEAPENSGIDFGEAAGSQGLYHDGAVMNILILGVDDYQPNDRGRSDSQMLLTIDTRHKKLKLTSFMRDMYVPLPDGWAPNRVNVAWSLGGAKLTVKTLESLFAVDIDRYVFVDFDQFDHIIDTLDGVEIDLTQREADLVNQYSGEKGKYLTPGLQNLTGKQARYYSRIREIDGDQGRTERQRKVVMALVEKMKHKDVFTLNSALAQILDMIKTNMSKNEVLSLAANMLTYLNYPVEQFRVPAEGTYQPIWVTISGKKASVLQVDLQENSDLLVKFLYENDVPFRNR